MTCSALCLAVATGFAVAAAADDKAPDTKPLAPITGARVPAKKADKSVAETTHEQVKEIAVKGEVSGNTLQTLCLDGDGNVVGLVAPGRYGAKPTSPVSEVQVFSPDGAPVRKWKVTFLGQSINAG